MKLSKKIVAVFCSVVMVLAMVPTAFATDTNPTIATNATSPTITINGAEGAKYGIYKIFSGTISTDTGTEGQISNVDWATGVNSTKLLTALAGATWTDTGVAFTADMTAAQVAAMMNKITTASEQQKLASLIGNNLETSATYEYTVEYEEGSTTVKSMTVAPGYYLVKSTDQASHTDGTATTYTDFVLAIANDVTVTPKNPDVPTVDKQVSTDNSTWDESVDASIGDTIYFKIEVAIPANYDMYDAYKFAVNDTLGTGFTLPTKSDLKVKVGTTDVTDSFVTATPSTTKGAIVSKDNLKDVTAVTASSTLTITYSATLNSSAIVGGEGNPNSATVTYGNDPTTAKTLASASVTTNETAADTVNVFTYELDWTKVDGADPTKALAGAKFKIKKSDTEFAEIDGGKIKGWSTTGTEISATATDGNAFAIKGLDAGTYTLVETTAPSGYDAMKDKSFTIVITATTQDADTAADTAKGITAGAKVATLSVKLDSAEAAQVTGDDLAAGKVTVQIKNTNVTNLPSTGGIGTTIFYVGGAIIVLGAIVALVIRRRTKSQK